jgi:hypothetical protein
LKELPGKKYLLDDPRETIRVKMVKYQTMTKNNDRWEEMVDLNDGQDPRDTG